MVDQEKLLKEIKTLSDSIRHKNRALKMGISERDKFLEQTFKPIIEPLKQITYGLPQIKPEGEAVLPHPQFKEEEYGEQYEPDVSTPTLDESELSSSRKQTTDEETEEDVQPSNISQLGIDIASKGVLGRKYLLKMLHTSTAHRKYHVYGARMEGNGLLIGNSRLDVDDDDNIHIGNKVYKGTKGLFELIFNTTPENYSKRDLVVFKQIIRDTNAHKKSYLPNGPIYRNRSKKYIDIISELFPTNRGSMKRRAVSLAELRTANKKRRLNKPVTGLGLLKDNYKTNIIYYNDLNKLVDRMRLLHEAKEAGHTGVENEWIALTDELRNRKVIS